MSQKLVLKRVAYGSDKTPMAEREYTLGMGYPCGTASEIREHYKSFKQYSEILLMDKDGNIEQRIKL